MLPLLSRYRTFFLSTAIAGLVLRLFFVVLFPAVTDDSHIYANLATNWLEHGIYGHSDARQTPAAQMQITPTDSRLPGYPAFLAIVFAIFGPGSMRAVMLIQAVADLATCLLIADLTRRLVSDRAARAAFLLSALCPFLANYVSAVLTETLEIFFTALALDCAAAALVRMNNSSRISASTRTQSHLLLWAATGAAISMCILLRPDGGILLAAVCLYLLILSLRNTAQHRGITATKNALASPFPIVRTMTAALVVAVFSLSPLIPWTVRNFRTLHHFQPLAPRYANDSDELVLRGFNRWVKTWMAEYASVEEVYWNVPGEKIDLNKLPARAIDGANAGDSKADDSKSDSESEKEDNSTAALIEAYNDSQDITPELDARFNHLADQRIRAHPIHYYFTLPLLRIADMWFRPRTEMLPPDVRWWEFNDDPARSACAVGFGLINLVYVGAALFSLFLAQRLAPAGRPLMICYAGLLVCFLLLRSIFLGTLENPEPRYTLECYPAIIALAAALTTRRANNTIAAR